MLVGASSLFEPAEAQVTTDGTLGRSPQILTGPNYQIGADLGRQVGSNLFHSFGQFGLRTGESATFSGPASVTNVIGRVTGSSVSNIDGTLRSTIPGASLYLINPSGIALGPNAALEITGSFHVSTADYLRFADGARFLAADPNSSTLTAAPSEAFGFLATPPSPIAINGSQLLGRAAAAFSVVGGEISIVGGAKVVSNGGPARIVSAGGPGEMPINPGPSTPTSPTAWADVRIAEQSTIDASSELGAGGTVFIRAGNLTLDHGGIVSSSRLAPGAPIDIVGGGDVALHNGAIVATATQGLAAAGDIAVAGRSVRIEDGASIQSTTVASGRSGSISVTAGQLTLQNIGQIGSFTLNIGNGGDVVVNASEILLQGGSFIATSTSASGRSGSVSVTARQLTLQNNGQIGSFTVSSGNGGNLTVTAGRITLRDGAALQAETTGAGAAGIINITADVLTLDNGGQITADTFGGSGRGGDVFIVARERLMIDGRDPTAETFTGVSAESGHDDAPSRGNAGNISLTAPELVIENGGSITTATEGIGHGGNIRVSADRLTMRNGAEIQAPTSGPGPGGTITVEVGAVVIDDVSQIQAVTFAGGRGGDVNVAARNSILIDGRNRATEQLTGIAAESRGELPSANGNAGSVTISAPEITLQNGADISSSAVVGRGGDITINASQIALHNDSQIAAVTGGPARGGTVSITADALTMDNGGAVRADTSGSGRGGNVAVALRDRLIVDGSGRGTEIFTGISATSSGSDLASNGGAGDLSVSAPNVIVRDGGRISTSSRGATRGGNIDINAGRMLLQNFALIEADSYGIAPGGAITVNAGALTLDNGGEITADTRGPGAGGNVNLHVDGALRLTQTDAPAQTRISALTAPDSDGPAGDVTITAKSLDVSGGALITSQVQGHGAGGNVQIAVSEGLTLSGADRRGQPSIIAAFSASLQPAGAISLEAETLTVRDGAGITTQANFAAGGAISIQSGGLVYLKDGRITTSVAAGQGGGGNITIERPAFVVLNGGTIVADAVGGDGGNIRISSDQFMRTPATLIQASSVFSRDGSIVIEAPNIDVSAAVVALPSGFLDASALVRDSCTAAAERPRSSLAPAGRGGLAQEGEGAQPAYYLADQVPEPGLAPAATPTLASAPSPPVSLACGRF